MNFNMVDTPKVGRSVFDLSYEKKFTCDMGQLIPVMIDEVVPGDKFVIANKMLVRLQPLVAPILHEINVYVHYFFVPYRLLWTSWETFITGGVDGPQVPETGPNLPRIRTTTNVGEKGSFWDYWGMPVGVCPDDNHCPLAFPWTAYQFIWNSYYRDPNVSSVYGTIPQTTTGVNSSTQVGDKAALRYRCWEKDYFTSALPWQQRGDAPALPISGTLTATWPAVSALNEAALTFDSLGDAPHDSDDKDFLENNTIDASDAATFDVNDMRLVFQVQKWLERNARAGYRYTEFLKSHFGVNPKDDRLDRPEYIGGSKTPIIISEVLQTSESSETSPQGYLAGHGITADITEIGSYYVQEFGLIMGLLSIMPKPLYQQGIDRQWLRKTRYDFYFPEFAHLSEQAIERAEIYTNTVEADNEEIFGYQGRYDEMRHKRSMVCSEMRDTFDYWHISRQFSAAPELNETFLLMSDTSPRKDCFAVPTDPGFMVSFGNIIKAIRPMPIMSIPGMIDH